MIGRLRGRIVRRMRQSGDEGSALALALTFMMIFGVLIGVVLEFATLGQRTTLSVREEATSTYAGGGALDGAVNRVRTTADGSESAGTTTCFTLPAAALGTPTAIDVTCTPRTGSGGDSAAALATQPGQAVLARGTNASEGVAVGAGTVLAAQGRVRVARQARVPVTATLLSTGPNASVQASDCTAATGTVTPTCTTTATAPADPGWAAPTAYPAMRRAIPACAAQPNVVTLLPGTYLSGVALQAAMACPNRVIWFQPGVYYLDFRDAAAADRELRVVNGAVVVGGAAAGWTPGTTAPAGVPRPTAALPAQSACNPAARGALFVFAGDSRLSVQAGGSLQLCADQIAAGVQHPVVQGLATQSAALPSAVPTAGTAALSAMVAGAGAAWTDADRGGPVDGQFGYAVTPRNTTSRALRVGPFPTGLVPPEATNIVVAVTLTGGMTGPGATHLRLTNGTTLLSSTLLRQCPVGGCNDGALTQFPVTITDPGLTAAIANAMYVDVLVSSPNVANPNGGTTTGAVDGITISVSFTAPMRATSGTGTAAPYVTGSAATTPILRTAGAFPATTAAFHGTIDAQAAAVDLGITLQPYIAVDRGVAVRHLQSAMSRAAGYTGPLISVPDLLQSPRRVLMEARDTGNVLLARADVSFGNVAGAAATTNGTVPTVNEFSVN